MSMDEFEQIKNGMAYEQITAIVGAPGVIIFEAGTPGDKLYTVTYQFKTDKEISNIFDNANAQLMFQNGKLITKSQTGMKKSTYEKFENLK